MKKIPLSRVFVNDEVREAGYYTLTWEGLTDARAQVPSGIYFVRMTADGNSGGHFSSVRKMLMMK